MIDFHFRCPMPGNIPEIDSWKSGDLNKVFERIVVDFPIVHIHSRPSAEEAINDPWVLTIDNFLTGKECERLIEMGHELGYERSTSVGMTNFDGTYEETVIEGRTSTNTWCGEECNSDPIISVVLQKIEHLTGIGDNCSEFLQLLRYEPGQYYNTHHDFIEHDLDRPQGVRVMTVFLYLNEPDEGGGTNFPDIGEGITIMPRKGTVLLWPSVLNDDPNAKDARTQHQALPVEKGIKYGANAWLHQRDYKTPNDIACT